MTARSDLVFRLVLGLVGGGFLLAGCQTASKADDGAKGGPAAAKVVIPTDKNPFNTADAVIEGRKIYLKNGCAGCHGMGGGGGMGKPLIDDEWKFGSDDKK